MADRLVQRVLARLEDGLPAVLAADHDKAMRLWMELNYRAVARERELVRVFQTQVPYTESLPAMQTLGARVLAFSARIKEDAGGQVHADFNAATLRLFVNLVRSTILQLVLDPPREVTRADLLNELAARLDAWTRHPR